MEDEKEAMAGQGSDTADGNRAHDLSPDLHGRKGSNIASPQALVERHAGGVAFDQLAHGLREQGRPGAGFFIELTHKMNRP